ncbi:MAG: hypothetical protein HY231_11245 [Acidobacteria bacterium]|nr:hypothetical protein [Acidobacteriota bacterium]
MSVKNYTIADGLARDYISCIKQDSHGYMWFCTSEGISRFDGYEFTNYGLAEGLPHRFVTDFLETHEGIYLFATNGGLLQFNPASINASGSHFSVIPLDQSGNSKRVSRLIEDETGALWCGTANGLYRLIRTAEGWQSTLIDLPLPQKDFVPEVSALAFDKQGSLWIGTGAGLYRLLPDGRIKRYTTQNGLSQDGISELLFDREQRMWVGTGDGLTLLVKDPRPDEQIAERVYRIKDGLLNNFIHALFQSADGNIWIGTRSGLNLLVEPKTNNGLSFQSYTTANGLRNTNIWDIAEDRDGNLWLGAESGGVMRIPPVGFTSFFETDGLGSDRISQLFSDHQGNVFVLVSRFDSLAPVIGRFVEHRFVKETLNLPPKTQTTWGWHQLILQDQKGDWWIPTVKGIFRFSGNKSFSELAKAKPTKVYTTKDGMNGNAVFRLFEDGRGDLWFSTLDGDFLAVQRWERSADKIHVYRLQESDLSPSAPTAFINDSEGNLWMGFYNGGVARYAKGRFTFYTEKDGVPADFVRGLFCDSKKRLWIATNSGLVRVDNPLAEKPQFVLLTTKDGLSSIQVTTITEDLWGQIYLGTGRGIDRLDPETLRIKHYTTTDGLADNFINVSMRDAQGTLWFGTLHGLSRFVPEPDQPRPPPVIVVSGLRIAGVKQTLSELGQTEVTIPDLSYRQNQLQIDFVSLSYAPGEALHYQFKFEDSGSDWSVAAEQRTITLANLSSGNYRFLVRAINSDGAISSQPASVSFRVLPPIWLRWWFFSLAALVLISAVVTMARLRNARQRERQQSSEALRQSKEQRLLELEQVRRRIATDLHDDVGSSLTQISLLSEVVRQSVGGNGKAVNRPLTLIAQISQELIDSMSDIVWAINPHKDRLNDLSQRMRHFASDVLTARQIDFRFRTPDEEQDIKVGANVRREVFLMFKESINNLVKHSRCGKAEIEFGIEAERLYLQISDDGQGFDASQKSSGNGLQSMSERSHSLGGKFEITSTPGQGTTLKFLIPISQADEARNS